MQGTERTTEASFGAVVEKMERIRREGNSSVVKRDNFGDYKVSESITFGPSAMPFASFGYIERLMRKLADEYKGKPFKALVLNQYREACGFFTGEIELTGQSDSVEFIDRIKFSWSGRGEIESTWDNFEEWQKKTIQ